MGHSGAALALSAAIVVGLVGCASPNDMIRQTPDAVYKSERSVDDITVCISEGWFASGPNPVNVMPVKGGQILMLTSMPGADAVAEVREWSGMVEVEYSERVPSMSPDWMKGVVLGCL